MADLSVRVGQKVETQDGKQGTVRYIGPLHVAAGEWLGLELPDDSGKNDGSVKGEQYFNCPPSHGIFVRKESAVRILSQQAPPAKPSGTPTPNGNPAKARPSSTISADVARKRQSLMSSGSGTTIGGRPSMRVILISPRSFCVWWLNLISSLPRSLRPSHRRLRAAQVHRRLAQAHQQRLPVPPIPVQSQDSV